MDLLSADGICNGRHVLGFKAARESAVQHVQSRSLQVLKEIHELCLQAERGWRVMIIAISRNTVRSMT